MAKRSKEAEVVAEDNAEVTELVMAAESEVRAPATIKVKVTAVLEVTPAYLKNVEQSNATVRQAIDGLASDLDGNVLSVSIA